MSGCVAAILWQTNSQSDAANLPDASRVAELGQLVGATIVGDKGNVREGECSAKLPALGSMTKLKCRSDSICQAQ